MAAAAPDSRAALLRSARRVLVKIGTGVLTTAGGRFDRPRFESLCEELGRAAQSRELVVVSSGAVALGVERLGLAARPKDIRGKQAAAAVGQSRLMRLYDDALGPRGVTVAQVLLTHADIQSRTRYLNARHALSELIERRALPIINENDTVSVEELKFGDNDTLAGMAVDLIAADLLIILTDIDGLYTADPRKDPAARRIEELPGIDEATLALAGGSTSGVGTGGMATKLLAARRAGESGVATLIAPGKRPGVLDQALAGEPLGTFVHAPPQPGTGSRKRWLARDLRPVGQIVIDEGAEDALCARGTSLLPRGIKEVRGTFDAGDPVAILALDGRPLARGLVSYSSDELRRILGVRTTEIADVLGYKPADEAVHRDDLVVLARPATSATPGTQGTARSARKPAASKGA
ncbi:MAG: glutamate 5-kinase [Polyangia bacterium]